MSPTQVKLYGCGCTYPTRFPGDPSVKLHKTCTEIAHCEDIGELRNITQMDLNEVCPHCSTPPARGLLVDGIHAAHYIPYQPSEEIKNVMEYSLDLKGDTSQEQSLSYLVVPIMGSFADTLLMMQKWCELEDRFPTATAAEQAEFDRKVKAEKELQSKGKELFEAESKDELDGEPKESEGKAKDEPEDHSKEEELPLR